MYLQIANNTGPSRGGMMGGEGGFGLQFIAMSKKHLFVVMVMSLDII